MRMAKSAPIGVLDGPDIILLTDLMLEWSQLNDIPVSELLNHRDILVARFQSGERCPSVLFDKLKIGPS